MTSGGPLFTRAMALAGGITDWQLRGPSYQRLFTGVYAPSDLPITAALLARGALLAAPPGSLAARHTAAELWRGIVPDQPDVHLAIPPSTRMQVAGIDARARPARRPPAGTGSSSPRRPTPSSTWPPT